jgi:hypothetical protein
MLSDKLEEKLRIKILASEAKAISDRSNCNYTKMSDFNIVCNCIIAEAIEGLYYVRLWFHCFDDLEEILLRLKDNGFTITRDDKDSVCVGWDDLSR